MSDYRTYIIAKKQPNEQLDALNRLSGRIYSKTVSLVRKTHRRKGFWLSKIAVKKYLKFKEYPCQAHSVQAIVDDYFGALGSYFSRVKKDSTSNPPYKTRKFHTFTWRATGISYRDGPLRLSMGKRRGPIWLSVHCGECKWHRHRDVVGASNILTKYQGWLFNPVVGAVVSPIGIRYQPDLCRLDSWSPFRGLISKKPSSKKVRSTRL